jgi:hypothetical protein
MYEAIGAGERRARNFVELDTDSLAFGEINFLGGDDAEGVEEEVGKIRSAIDRHYLSRIRNDGGQAASVIVSSPQ